MNEFLKPFQEFEDPRLNRQKLHPIENVLFISFCAVLAGADDFQEIEMWGNLQKDWLGQYLDLTNGIPSQDTFNRVLGLIKTEKFERLFRQLTGTLFESVENQVVSLDGKTLRGSGSKNNQVQMLSIWVNDQKMALGQVKIGDKTNEIPGIPLLLDDFELSGAIITADALNCQTAIADKIIEKNADYLLSVKGNQGGLYEKIQDYIAQNSPADQNQTVGKDHGRIETRTVKIYPVPDWFDDNGERKGLKTLVKVDRKREFNDKIEEESSYYISSLEAGAERFQQIARGHWGIENNLHWLLDVAFREDQSQIENKNAAANFSILRRLGLNIIQNDKNRKTSIKNTRKKAGWDTKELEKLLLKFYN